MKIVEPVSSALLITACVYSAGVSQNNYFLRRFDISPEFSQLPVEKILYDGGILTYGVVWGHLIVILKVIIFLLFVIGSIWLTKKEWFKAKIVVTRSRLSTGWSHVGRYNYAGWLFLLYMMYLTFAAYDKGRIDGEALADSFIRVCHQVELVTDKGRVKTCAFRKDKDSIWYLDFEKGSYRIGSKLLSEIDEIIYHKKFKQASNG